MRLSNNLPRNRRGTVTVIVVAFLALFAVLGLTFLIASQRFATTTRLNREAMTRERDNPPQPDVLMQRIMCDLLYDGNDDDTGVGKSTRGWGLARLMYGQHPSLPNTLPYSGIGRKRGNVLPNSVCTALGLPAGSTDYTMLHYKYFSEDGFVRDPERAGPTGGVRLVANATLPVDSTNAPPNPNDTYWPINSNQTSADENNPYLAVIDPNTGEVLLPSFHRPSCFGTSDPVNDKWGLSVSNPNWTSPVGKYLTFRPRPNEHSPSFPMPKTNANGTFGDVENLEGKAIGTQYDSLWMDLDLPVSYWRGKRYKPLVAVLITDLDNRVNLNTAGNLRSGGSLVGRSHGANQNLGPWETNLGNVLVDPNDLNRLLNGANNGAGAIASGRYGGATATATAAPFPGGYSAVGPFVKPFTTYANDIRDNNPTGGYLPHFYAPVDMDGGALVVPGLPTDTRSRPPAAGSATSPYEQFPVFGSQTPTMSFLPFTMQPPYSADNRYWNGRSDNEAVTMYSERLNHPMLYNPYLNAFKSLGLGSISSSVDSKTFQASEMIALNAKYIPGYSNAVHPVFGGTTPNSYSGLLRSDAARLTSLGLTSPTITVPVPPASLAANRFRVTTISNDVDKPGGTPWFFTSAASPNPPTPFTQPIFAPNFPFFGAQQAMPTDASTSTPTGGGDYDPTRRQSLVSVLGAVDLHRPLTDYRDPAKAGSNPYNYTQANLAPTAQVNQAIADRQNLADDIFVRLRAATGTGEPSTLTPGTPQFLAAQMLAQLAVNIVDYIDHDDYVTPYNWNPSAATLPPADPNGNLIPANTSSSWVFGHELPRLVVNEAMVRLENDPSEPDLANDPNPGRTRYAQKPYKMRVWTELHNPLTPRDLNEIGQSADLGQAVLYNTTGGYPIYRMRIVKGSATTFSAMLNPANPGGEPPATETFQFNGNPLPPAVLNTSVGSPVMAVSPNVITSSPTPVYGYADQPNTTTPAFYIAGPKGDAPSAGAMPKTPDSTGLTANGQFDNMEYEIPSAGLTPATITADTTGQYSPVIVLQRLANEHLPPGQYNPYVTVDTFMPANYTNTLGTLPNANAAVPPVNVTPVSIVQDRLQITSDMTAAGDRIKSMMVPAWNTIYSFGKRQPYHAQMNIPAPSTDVRFKQQPSESTQATQMQHTFHRHNGKMADGSVSGGTDTLHRPFTPMTHLDRGVNGVGELMQVSQFGTHMVGQLYSPFGTGPGGLPNTGPLLYKANWLNETTNLYRAFDLLTTHRRFYGQGANGRVPGLVNLNTLTDRTVFDSLLDFQHCSDGATTLGTNGKHYTQADVSLLWNQLISVRKLSSANLLNGTTQPILGTMSPIVPAGGTDPQYPNGMGSSFTLPGLIRDIGPNLSSLQAQQELLETLQPNVTTRSNTFAIYATIGFFEVLNPGTGTDGLTYPDANNKRPILGSEIIGVDGKAVRYKFFSVVDRTQLSVDKAGQNLQGIGNVHFSYEPVAWNTPPTLPTLAANPVNAGSPDPQPNGSPIYVTVAIPRTSVTSGTATGNYDGIAWKLKAGDQLILDGNSDAGAGSGVFGGNTLFPSTAGTRNRMEIVNVASVTDDPTNARALVTISISKPHTRGSNMRMFTPNVSTFPFVSQPGNPAGNILIKQLDTFNLGANTYKTVVPVFERIDGY
ncbi:hypothetical protein [Zavarzinella formosa]|uniref:hypothetical protein n=1 Tax=Zavarzinella formosa TaxID=360055 RepID=UPI0002E2E7A6|nr:hypothetical protein [Zavarzinella formosa]